MLSFLWWFVIGPIVGWTTGRFMRERGRNGLYDALVGVLGAILGGNAGDVLGARAFGGVYGSMLCAAVGALLLIIVFRKVTEGKTGTTLPRRGSSRSYTSYKSRMGK